MDEAARKRAEHLRRVFGDALPDTTADERDDGGPDRDDGRERWYRENRPPHHDPPS